LVTHDSGFMVGFAVAATHPKRMSRGGDRCAAARVGPWDQIKPGSGHVAFWLRWKDMERLVAAASASISTVSGTNFPGTRSGLMKVKRQHYAALYAQPGAMRAGFAQFLAFSQMRPKQDVPAQGRLQMRLGLRWRSYIPAL